MRSPEHPCPNHNSVRVPSSCGHQSIHAQTIIPFVFQEHTVTRASMPCSFWCSVPFSGTCRIPCKLVFLQETCNCRARIFCRSTFEATTILTATFQAATFFRARCKGKAFFRDSFGLKTCLRASCTSVTFCKETVRPGNLFMERCKAATFLTRSFEPSIASYVFLPSSFTSFCFKP